MKNILITGASGFLGSHLIEALQKMQFKVYALTSKKDNLKGKYENCELYSIKEWENNLFPINEIDVVVHCAFARAHKEGKEIAESLLFSNTIFKKVVQKKIPAIINISTQEVYGKSPIPWIENIVEPSTIYGVAKFFSEINLLELSKTSNTKATNIRLAGLLGIETESRMVNKFVYKAIKDEPLKLLDGRLVFSQLYITDAVNGIISLLNIPFSKWEPVYNLGYTKSYSIIEIANTVKKVGKVFNKNIQIILEKSNLVIEAELDSSSFNKVTEWSPKFDMESIVMEIYKSRLK